MKKSKFYLLSGFLGLLITTIAVSTLASAHSLNNNNFSKRNLDPAKLAEIQTQHDAIETALDNGDYQAWRDLIDSRPKITDFITENNFEQFVQMHKYMQEGDFQAAQEIHDQLGLDQFGPGLGMMRGLHRGGHGVNDLQDSDL